MFVVKYESVSVIVTFQIKFAINYETKNVFKINISFDLLSASPNGTASWVT